MASRCAACAFFKKNSQHPIRFYGPSSLIIHKFYLRVFNLFGAFFDEGRYGSMSAGFALLETCETAVLTPGQI
jgi:hypothetical protein